MTLRSVLLGTLMAVLVNIGSIYSSYIVASTRTDHGHLSIAVLIPFVLLLGLNILIRALRPRSALTSGELIVIFVMGMIAATMQGEWLAGYFLGTISAPHYFASPENQWGQYLLRYIPNWPVVTNGTALRWFYEGLPEGQSIPWIAWIIPLFWWAGFLGALLLVNFSIVVILRKQWVERERLPFPLAEIPLMLADSPARSVIPRFMRSPLFLIGFFSVFLIICWNIASWFTPLLPPFPLLNGWRSMGPSIRIGRGFPSFSMNLNIFVIVFGYFARLDVLFSIWLFNILTLLQAGIFSRIGYSIGGFDPWCSHDAATGWQSFGGFIFFVVWGLWIARSHLKSVFRKAFTGRGQIDDRSELISYRTALFSLIFCVLYIVLWLRTTGMELGPILVFLAAQFILYIGVTRIVAESGLVYMRGPITAQAFTWRTFGASGMAPPSAVGLALTYTFFCDAKGFAITCLSHITKMAEAIRARKRWVTMAVVLAVFVGAVSAISYILYQGYSVGSYNFGGHTFDNPGGGIGGVWEFSASRIKNPSFGTDSKRLSFLGIGAVFTAILTYLRYRLPWWPIHPIGFIISSSAVISNAAFSIFIVWLIKTILLRLGGPSLYRRAIPLFLGMLCGYLLGVGLGAVVDFFWFYGCGHEIHIS